MTAWYNEIDPYAAQWLRNLIKAGHIAPGYVDERSIVDVKPEDLTEFTQCHFFAGIGVWSYALRQAGWPDDKPVWTGSCPCQPFSSSGKGDGFNDERHLWPSFAWLIEQHRPSIVFGEQVASKAVDAWIDLVQTDMEGMGYAFASIPFPSAGVGAPHIRDRNFWLADSNHNRQQSGARRSGSGESPTARNNTRRSCKIGTLANTNGTRSKAGVSESQQREERDTGKLNYRGSELSGPSGPSITPSAGPVNGFWSDADWLLCRDGKWRPVEPGTSPLADGIANRMVCSCTECETETVIYEKLLVLRKIGGRYERRQKEEVLRQRVLSTIQAINSATQQKHGALPRESPYGNAMLSVPINQETAGTSQRQKPSERQPDESGNSLFSMPSQRALIASAAIDVRRLWGSILSGKSSSGEQDLFCTVCEEVRPHLCSEEVVKNRTSKLRAYGNAINAEAAKTFIESYMEAVS
ncbi:C-5 cytosine-specific DNA methylase [Yersinia mollaretii]|uniref:C-5 cytosine-specific DNA methylase n=1 Tax=Yersinia mollaretii TaxID=33060 RepID=A0AA36LPV9_YERMO|nr:DNA cytosine methyltransferase [Yersinia mollaretii]CNI13105.1 C-5 cytosine-specific DNA methylase [Yersinia mollaretii]